MYGIYEEVNSGYWEYRYKGFLVGNAVKQMWDTIANKSNSWMFTGSDLIKANYQAYHHKIKQSKNEYCFVISNRNWNKIIKQGKTSYDPPKMCDLFAVDKGIICAHFQKSGTVEWSVVKLRLHQLFPDNNQPIDADTNELPRKLKFPRPTGEGIIIEYFYLRDKWLSPGGMHPALIDPDAQIVFQKLKPMA